MIEPEEDMAGICSGGYFGQNFIKLIFLFRFFNWPPLETCELLTPVVVQPRLLLRPSFASSCFLPHSLSTKVKHASLPGMILVMSNGLQSVEAHTFVVLETMAKWDVELRLVMQANDKCHLGRLSQGSMNVSPSSLNMSCATILRVSNVAPKWKCAIPELRWGQVFFH